MELINLDRQELSRLYHTEMVHDFPKTELKPLNNMFQMMDRNCYDPWLAVEQSEAVGYAMVWLTMDRTGALLDYLGVLRGKRNRGSGGQILSLLAERYDQLLIEAEAPVSDDPAENELCRRRIGFYQRNGCRLLDYDCALFSVHYKCLYQGHEADDRRLEAMHRSIYAAQFSPRLMERYVQLPLLPGDAVHPASMWIADENEAPDSI